MKKSLFVMAILIVLLVASMAFADTKIYPGHMCVPWNPKQPAPLLSYGAIENSSTTNVLKVDCPVIGDGGDINSAWMTVRDLHYNKNFSATLISIYASGSGFVGWTSPRTYSSGASRSAQSLSFGFLSGALTTHHYITCSIPPIYNGNRSSIISYAVKN